MNGFLTGMIEAAAIIALYESQCWMFRWIHRRFSSPRRPQPPPINWHYAPPVRLPSHAASEGDRLIRDFMERERAKVKP